MPSSSSASSYPSKAAELRSVLQQSLSAIAGRTDERTRCLVLSGGVDTCAILAASAEIGMTYAAAITVIVSDHHRHHRGVDSNASANDDYDKDDGNDEQDEQDDGGDDNDDDDDDDDDDDNDNEDEDEQDDEGVFPPNTNPSLFDAPPPDEAFAIEAARKYARVISSNHIIIRLSSLRLLRRQLRPCIEALRTYDGMTLRNSLVISEALHKAWVMGCTDAIVGDGADELFGGYSFMWGCEDDPIEWKERRDRMCREWTFATEDLAAMYGGRDDEDKEGNGVEEGNEGGKKRLKSHGPFMDPTLVEWALKNTAREDCIGVRPIRLVHGGDAMEHITGKVVLREAYDTVASWRRKDPIEVGSGIAVIGRDEYWASSSFSSSTFDDAYEKHVKEALSRGFVIRSREQLANFRIFDKCVLNQRNGTPRVVLNAKRCMLGQGCAGCCFEIGDKNFCRICGMFPAQRGAAKA